MFLNSKQELPPNPGQNTMEKPMSDDKQGESPIELRLKEMEQEIRKMHSVRAQDLADLQDRDEKLKLIELERKQANWDRLAKALPRGWVHGAQEEKSRQEFESNPTEFVLKLVDELNQSHKLAMEKAGEEFQRKSVNPPGKLADVCTGLRVNGKAVGES